ncbi:methyl-accepting chemotaxis protein [Pseudaquabacterium pictum]|uniref:Methyl-accepting chemotaxis protein n=1 Tax=Pseudaquabacterium pictum TaxID=2315236 RepID=A0A480AP89_9BURK|nr:methyl-accepting chemotaxis protein [Rubrivivax pictus]GCL63233.1 methyl-accepting chemotaxis protein [Rubrivivax pictus]
MSSQLTVSQRLSLGFAVLALLLLAVCAASWLTVNRTQDMVSGDLRQAQDRLARANEMVQLVFEQDLHLRQVGLVTDPPTMERHATLVRQAGEKLEKMLDALGNEPDLSTAEKALLGEVRSLHDKSKPVLKRAMNLALMVMQEDAAKVITGQLDQLSQQRRDRLLAFNTLQREQASAAEARIGASSRHASVAMLVAAVAGVLLAAVAGVLCTRSVVRPLQAAVQAAQQLADGDLRVRLDSSRRDEFGQLLGGMNRMAESLRGVIGTMRSSAESVRNASAEIAAGNHDLSSRTEQQASSLQSTVSTVAELGASVRRNAEAAQQATRLAADASGVASQGGQRVGEVVSTMDEISQSSRRIADIVGVIDGIAFQTNILALNAAVEAARAGEQGRGFAVVAGEVRSLAQRSAGAAREIKTLISANVEKVESGTRLVADAGSTMSDIVQSSERVAAIISEISQATQEQASGLELVSGAVQRIDEATQQNAALVEQSAAAASSLQDQTVRLNEAVGVFQVADQSSDR